MCLRKSSCTFFAIAAMALAACGDGGDGSTTTTTTTGDNNPSGQLSVSDLLLTATQQRRNASTAKTAADTALKEAKEKAAMLSAAKVLGESSKAKANAQAVLDATDTVDQALKDATAALTALEKAKTEADKLPTGTPKLQELKTSITDAITDATKHRDAVKAIKDAKATETGSLAAQRQLVTGVNGDMSPDKVAENVAIAVEKAMTIYTGQSTSTLRPLKEITGGITPPTNTHYSFDSVVTVATSFPVPAGATATAAPAVVANFTKLRADYTGMTIYDLPGAKVKETDYAKYGYWLAIPSESDTIAGLYTFAFPSKNVALPDAAIADDDSLGNSATYNGKALGISVMTADDGNGGQKAVKSGEFTADVRLTATFAGNDDSKVKGEIYNFEGDAVGDDWSIALKDALLLRSGSAADFSQLGLARGSGSGAEDDAPWSAKGSAGGTDDDPKRPMEIHGGFGAIFPDGRAAGAYSAVKDD